MIYNKWNPPSEDGRYVDYDAYEELAGKYLKTQKGGDSVTPERFEALREEFLS